MHKQVGATIDRTINSYMSFVIRNVQNGGTKPYRFADLRLDLTTRIISTLGINDAQGRDINVLYDEAAIANSVSNILAASPGSYVLKPDFECDLKRFLFEPISQFRGQSIGEFVYGKLTTHEPRVKIHKVSVVADEDRQLYDITIIYSIPSLSAANKQNLRSMGGILTQSDAISILPRPL